MEPVNFVCNKDGCNINQELPKEIKDKLIEWGWIEREGCWNPTAKKCDCLACGGYND